MLKFGGELDLSLLYPPYTRLLAYQGWGLRSGRVSEASFVASSLTVRANSRHPSKHGFWLGRPRPGPLALLGPVWVYPSYGSSRRSSRWAASSVQSALGPAVWGKLESCSRSRYLLRYDTLHHYAFGFRLCRAQYPSGPIRAGTNPKHDPRVLMEPIQSVTE